MMDLLADVFLKLQRLEANTQDEAMCSHLREIMNTIFDACGDDYDFIDGIFIFDFEETK